MPATTIQPDAPQIGEDFPSTQDLHELLGKVKASLVNQYPTLAKNPDFQKELDSEFGKFVNESVQRGSDPNEVWSKTVKPVMDKWAAQAPRDIASELQREDARANQLRASGAASALDIPSMFPNLTSPKSPYLAAWEARMNRDQNQVNHRPVMSLADEAKAKADQKAIIDAANGLVKPNPVLLKQYYDELDLLDKKYSLKPTGAVAALGFDSSLPNVSDEHLNPDLPQAEFDGRQVHSSQDILNGFTRLNPDSLIQVGGKTIRGNPSPRPASAALTDAQARLPDFTGVPVGGASSGYETRPTAAIPLTDGVNVIPSFAIQSPNELDNSDQIASLQDKIKRSQTALGSYVAAGIGPGNPLYDRTAQGMNDFNTQLKTLTVPKNAGEAAAAALSDEHPSWTPDQLSLAASGKMAGASIPREGQTASNPQTGEKIIFQNGQWQPVQ